MAVDFKSTVKPSADSVPIPEKIYDINEVRANAQIYIMLPMPADDGMGYDLYEFVTVNGKTTQIKKGENVGVSWQVYQALKQGQYANVNILL